MEGFEYEGESVVAVFADREMAEQRMAQCMAADTDGYYVYGIDEHEVVQ